MGITIPSTEGCWRNGQPVMGPTCFEWSWTAVWVGQFHLAERTVWNSLWTAWLPFWLMYRLVSSPLAVKNNVFTQAAWRDLVPSSSVLYVKLEGWMPKMSMIFQIALTDVHKDLGEWAVIKYNMTITNHQHSTPVPTFQALTRSNITITNHHKTYSNLNTSAIMNHSDPMSTTTYLPTRFFWHWLHDHPREQIRHPCDISPDAAGLEQVRSRYFQCATGRSDRSTIAAALIITVVINSDIHDLNNRNNSETIVINISVPPNWQMTNWQLKFM